ncbi:MAG: phytanoyl-CoA hydroxylase, partial [Kribbellaceae bacterium]|nr:phytanoyl-CoA hydroxylase [Kribbellaceae bacterium]
MTMTQSRTDLPALATQYAEQGFVLVKGLLSKEEAAAYRETSHALLARLNRDDDPTWQSAMG